MNCLDKITGIKAFIFDIDGVMTDGTVGYTGTETIKFFNIKDGHAIRMAIRLDYKVGMLSGRDDPPNRQRAEDLDLSFYYGGQKDKLEGFRQILIEHNLSAEECLFVGDDVIDIPVMRRCGIGVCVADAAAEVPEHADWVTNARGGGGAVREVITRVLTEQGRWKEAMARYLQ